jgi:hypothetical protein
VKIGAKSRTWALTEQGRLAATAGRTVWLPVVDVDQISDAEWQAMAAARDWEPDANYHDGDCPACGHELGSNAATCETCADHES